MSKSSQTFAWRTSHFAYTLTFRADLWPIARIIQYQIIFSFESRYECILRSAWSAAIHTVTWNISFCSTLCASWVASTFSQAIYSFWFIVIGRYIDMIVIPDIFNGFTAAFGWLEESTLSRTVSYQFRALNRFENFSKKKVMACIFLWSLQFLSWLEYIIEGFQRSRSPQRHILYCKE